VSQNWLRGFVAAVEQREAASDCAAVVNLGLRSSRNTMSSDITTAAQSDAGFASCYRSRYGLTDRHYLNVLYPSFDSKVASIVVAKQG